MHLDKIKWTSIEYDFFTATKQWTKQLPSY